MKYVLINSWCKFGSTGKITYGFHKYLIKKNNESYIFYGRGEKDDNPNLFLIGNRFDVIMHKFLSLLFGLQGFFSTYYTRRLIKKIKKINPDFVYLFNIHGYFINYFMLLNFLKTSNFKIKYVMFDEYPFLGKCTFSVNCEKFKLKCNKCVAKSEYPKSLFFDFSNYVFNKKKSIFVDWFNLDFIGVDYTINKAMTSSILKHANFESLNFGINTKEIYMPIDYLDVVNLYNIPNDKFVVLTVGFSSDSRKGISIFLDIASKLSDDFLFINVGYDKKLTNKQFSNFLPIKFVENKKHMAQLYSRADIYITTSYGEAMSLACLEALACGTPILGFKNSSSEYIATEPCGLFVNYNDIDAMVELIKSQPKKEKNISDKCRKLAVEKYDEDLFYNNLFESSKRSCEN